MSRRKEIVHKLFGKEDRIKEPPNIKKRDKDEPEATQDHVPEQFKKEMSALSKEELVMELFFTKVELMHTKRDLELSTFKNIQDQERSEGN